ncbi:MAG TPA: glycosyl hydrolase family 39 [Candidatus Binatia bacterium]|nr:glycosyl hydrolase family 39 [Candidatus Binatia bacterium]
MKIFGAAAGLALTLSTFLSPQDISYSIVLDAHAPGRPFPHFWEETFGSGRAILTLRESYRNDLREVKKVTDFRYVRFHNILHDEVGVYDEDERGNPVYNFAYVDQIYDGLLANGVRPFVEISFMPKKLAERQDVHPFWYHPIVSPPKDYAKWDALMRALAQHLIERYGIEEVAQWYFEVWNEPNIDFWTGDPKEATYFELYDHTARTLKAVNSRLRVGGPSTSSAHWVDEFIRHVTAENVPVDFISSHGYADDTVEDLFGTHEDIPMDQRVCRAIRKVHDQIAASARPKLPLTWTEWNVPSFGALHARDTEYVGAALADDIRQCDGLVDMMSFWTFSDVFEEGGPKQEPFDGGFGLMAMGGIKKPSYTGFAVLHKLGQERIPLAVPNVLVTRGASGKLIIAAWNLADPDKKGSPENIQFQISGVAPNAAVRMTRADAEHGNTLEAYRRMGSPRYPTRAQVEQLNRVADENRSEDLHLTNSQTGVVVPVNGIVLLEVE